MLLLLLSFEFIRGKSFFKKSHRNDKGKLGCPMVAKADNFQFENPSKKGMLFQEVVDNIQKFMESDPRANYRLMIGTDSQSYANHTRFITGIILRREGNGSWSCMRKVNHSKKIVDLHDKISRETKLTEEVADLLTEELRNKFLNILKPNEPNGASFIIEGHMDIGLGGQNKTGIFVEEMMRRIEQVGLVPKIKPHSIAASTYANKYTK